MASRPPLTSPDGSSNRNPPERCPRPLYSRDSTQEDQEILQEDQYEGLIVVKVEDEEEAYEMGDDLCKKEEDLSEISTDPGDTRETPRDVKDEEEEEGCVRIKEDVPIEISTDGARNIPERSLHPLYSRDSTQEHHEIPQEDQDGYPIDNEIGADTINSEEEEHETSVKGDDPYKEEDISPEISTDGSSTRNPPERCPRPLYSRDSTQEDQEIPQEDQCGYLITVEAEKAYVTGDDPCKEKEIPPVISTDGSSNRNPPERCPRPLYSRDSTQEHQEILKENRVDRTKSNDFAVIKIEDEEEMSILGDEPCKEKEIPPVISTDGSSNRNPPERCPRPLYSRDSTQEHQEIFQEDQSDDFTVITVEDEEEMSNLGDEPSKEEEIPPEVSTDPGDTRATSKDLKAGEEEGGQVKFKEDKVTPEISTDGTSQNNLTKCPVISLDSEVEDTDITSDSSDYDSITPQRHSVLPSADLSSDPSTHGVILSDRSPAVNHTSHGEGDLLEQSEGGENVTQGGNFVEKETNDTGQKDNSFSCPECGKCFALRSSLTRHRRVHTGTKPYVCSKCGKRFLLRSYLTSHEKVHSGEKPYSCPECGKRFAVKSGYTRHQKVHSAERPFCCSQCGKSFQWKSSLDYHTKTHDVEKPFACQQCGKSFQWRTFLDFHMHTHTNEKPLSS